MRVWAAVTAIFVMDLQSVQSIPCLPQWLLEMGTSCPTTWKGKVDGYCYSVLDWIIPALLGISLSKLLFGSFPNFVSSNLNQPVELFLTIAGGRGHRLCRPWPYGCICQHIRRIPLQSLWSDSYGSHLSDECQPRRISLWRLNWWAWSWNVSFVTFLLNGCGLFWSVSVFRWGRAIPDGPGGLGHVPSHSNMHSVLS